MEKVAFDITLADKPGALNSLTEVICKEGANIAHISTGDKRKGKTKMYIELENVKKKGDIEKAISKLDVIVNVKEVPTFNEIYGKRVIVIGGGAQVAEVATGAVNEADRHNIRGERISVDTVPLVGEDKLADAVRAVARLPRAEVLVLAGSIMGGKVTEAVKEIRDMGVIVISLNMVGSVPDEADLVVTDPIQAGVMAVMAISDNAQFDISKVRGKRF